MYKKGALHSVKYVAMNLPSMELALCLIVSISYVVVVFLLAFSRFPLAFLPLFLSSVISVMSLLKGFLNGLIAYLQPSTC